MDEPRQLTAADLRVGLEARFEREVTLEDVTAFADLSRDRNPLHTDEAYARGTNYGARIVHGAFQVGLASAMAGMYLPGREVLVGGFQCRFPAPLYYPSRVLVQGEITTWDSHSARGNLRVRITEISAGVLTSEIHVAFSLHESRRAPRIAEESAQAESDGRPIVLITGAGGGLGSAMIAFLSEQYHIVGLARSRPEQPAGGVEWIAADLAADDWELLAAEQLHGRRLHGLVHAAWPRGPQGGLLDAEREAVRIQLEFGGDGIIRLARFLRSHAAAGARFVVLGTTAATIKPALNMAAYSLGKATLEHTVRLLAPELARANITINTVAPSFVPAGMNEAKTSRVVLAESAKVPLGRLCAPEDVAQAVSFFLSSGSAFITGQTLPLTGGQL